jgi:hypothetical protein
MSFAIRLFILIVGLGLFILVFELVRKKKLREELSIVWLVVSIIVALGSVLDKIIDPVAKMLKIHYPPVFAFMLVILILIISQLYFSIVTSDLKDKVKKLTQQIALLEFEINKTKPE